MAKKIDVNKIEYNPSTNELTIWTNGKDQFIFDMDLIGQGGGSGIWDDISGKPSSSPANVNIDFLVSKII